VSNLTLFRSDPRYTLCMTESTKAPAAPTTTKAPAFRRLAVICTVCGLVRKHARNGEPCARCIAIHHR
jgi:hypothetical protein